MPNAPESAPETAAAQNPAFMPIMVFIIVYPLMAMAVLLENILSYARFAGIIRRNRTRARKDELYEYVGLCGDVVPPRLYRSTLATTPMLVGFFKPEIVLPDREYSEAELRSVLRHELIHLRRRDIVVKWLSVFVCALHWFNPVVWLARREIDRACELSCDEAAIRDLDNDGKQDYGNTLISVAADIKASRAVLSTTMCEEKEALKERLYSIMMHQKLTRAAKCVSTVVIIISACIVCILGAGATAPSGPGSAPAPAPVPVPVSVAAPVSVHIAEPEPVAAPYKEPSAESYVGQEKFYTAFFKVNSDLKKITSIPGVLMRFHGNVDMINPNDFTRMVLTQDGNIVDNPIYFNGVISHFEWYYEEVTDFYFVFDRELTEPGRYRLTGLYRGKPFTLYDTIIENSVSDDPADPNELLGVSWGYKPDQNGKLQLINEVVFQFEGTQQSFYQADLSDLKLTLNGVEIEFSVYPEVYRNLGPRGSGTGTSFSLRLNDGGLNTPGTYLLTGEYRGTTFTSSDITIP